MSSDKKVRAKNDIRHASNPRVGKGRGRLGINSKSLLVPSAREGSLYKKAFDLSKRSGNAERVAALLQESHRQGDVRATYALATWHIHGVNLPRNRSAGIKLLRKASKGGIREAKYDLAHAYEMGIGVAKSYKKALDLYIKAAQDGDLDSVTEVIRCVFYGKGILRNKELAYLIRDLNRGRRRG
jgi:TPR repeat protein